MNIQDAEYAALQVLRSRLEKDGFEVLDEVTHNDMPIGLRGYLPDLVARKGDQFRAIEIKVRKNLAIHKKLEEIKSIIEQDPNWTFQIYYSDDFESQGSLNVQSVSTVEGSLREAQLAFKSGQLASSFLLTWAAFEASARRLHPRIFSKPQSPGRIVMILAERGEIDPLEAQKMRDLLAKRNALIHGQLDIKVTNTDMESLLQITIKVLENSKKR